MLTTTFFGPFSSGDKVVYRRYASLFFVAGISSSDNELITLEIIHRYVEVLDRYFVNVAELDLIFNFQAVSVFCREEPRTRRRKKRSGQWERSTRPPAIFCFCLLADYCHSGILYRPMVSWTNWW